MRHPMITLAVVLALAPAVQAATITYNDGAHHTVNSDLGFTDIYLYDNPMPPPLTTSLSVAAGGAFNDLYANDTSIVNVSGGDFHDAFLGGSSEVEISGGLMNQVFIGSSSEAEISGGLMQDVYTNGSGQLVICDGTMGYLFVNDGSQAGISGGTMSDIFADDSSGVAVSGGAFGELWASDTSTIDVYGLAFNYPVGPISDLSGTLMGTLINGDPVNSDFYQDSAGQIVLHVGVIPEPLTAMGVVAAVGTVACYWRRRLRG